jgi:NADH:ubiquinone oxidoreductase subunit 4 (subunit M)
MTVVDMKSKKPEEFILNVISLESRTLHSRVAFRTDIFLYFLFYHMKLCGKPYLVKIRSN